MRVHIGTKGVAMPMPLEYAQASTDFDNFMQELRVELNHETTHQTFQTVQSVLVVFRRRLSVAQGLWFADVLPPVLRAIFVKDWNPGPPLPFADAATLGREVQGYRASHDFSPDDAIPRLARVLRHHLPDPIAFDRVLEKLPEGARAFWMPPAC